MFIEQETYAGDLNRSSDGNKTAQELSFLPVFKQDKAA